MAKAITEVAIGAAAIGMAIAMPGIGAGLAWMTLSMQTSIIGALVGMGGSMVMAGISDALAKNQGGLAVAVTTPIGPWGYIYGTQKVGGVEIFRQSNNNTGVQGETSSNKQLHRVYAIAAHSSHLGSWQLRIDGRQVLLQNDLANPTSWKSYSPGQQERNITSISRDINGLVTVHLASGIPQLDGQSIQITEVSGDNTLNGVFIVTQPDPSDDTTFEFVSGGPVISLLNTGQFWTLYSDYKDKIRVEWLDGHHTETFQVLSKAGTAWGASDKLLGRTAVYVQMGYDASVFPSSIPNVSFVLDGKDDILDPRTGFRGFTKNAALCIADYMSLPATKGGFGLAIGTDIPTAPLIAAANICDEAVPLAAGGTIARYTCNTFFQLNATRGTILSNMLSSCAGRITWTGGQYSIFPAAWVAPTLQLTEGDLRGPIQWKPRLSIRDTANSVKGTYVSPENAYQQSDVPAYMQDYNHGYGLETDPGQGDQWLVEDNLERIFKEANFPCTDNAATAQRLEKIALLRIRHQGRGTIRCSMKAYQVVGCDVIQLTHARWGWSNKYLEVLRKRFVVDKSGDAPVLAVELDVAETASLIYDWATTEELTPFGYTQPYSAGSQVCQPPESVTLYSGPGGTFGGITYPSTITTGADGRVQNSLLVVWITPNDDYVTSGGHIEVQWAPCGMVGGLLLVGPYVSAGKFDPSVNSCFLTPVTDGQQYMVRVRAVNCVRVASIWVQAGPETISDTYSTPSYSGVPVAPAGTLTAQSFSGGTSQITGIPFQPPWGALCTPTPNTISGLSQSQLYWVYYIDPGFAGGAITMIATQNQADFENKDGYFLIGSIVTPAYTPRYQPNAYHDLGSSTSINPTAAYDNNVASDAIFPCSWGTSYSGGVYSAWTAYATCMFNGFPSVVTSAPTTLTVYAGMSAFSGSSGSASGTIQVKIGGVVTTLATLTAPTRIAAYTMTIPSGTDLSTISVTAQANITAGTPPGAGNAQLEGFEIYIQ